MSVRTSDEGHVCWYCSTSGIAFGPVFKSADEADDFLIYVEPRHGDPRNIGEDRLAEIFRRWKGMVALEH